MDECGPYNRFMQTLRTIVVGTDFSECAEHALDTALPLACLGDARITRVPGLVPASPASPTSTPCADAPFPATATCLPAYRAATSGSPRR